ncbi:hypothetical protein JQK88_07200 [Mesorhizobium caraganae]|uniref:hypothetical protein n=1 Tax=Mesorhizobium caraganae TaxID=483206 RepID=UPI0019397F86|nr:hypothetical protein [Mesorhizobium caraganae]MBM2711036.1 hypothetical protein [Mesorhizobium caraganae]
MGNRDLSTSRQLAGAVRKQALSTTTRRWTTAGTMVAMLVAVIFVPAMGLALMGTAFAVWWFAVAIMMIFGGLVGGVIGLNKTNKNLHKRKSGKTFVDGRD